MGFGAKQRRDDFGGQRHQEEADAEAEDAVHHRLGEPIQQRLAMGDRMGEGMDLPKTTLPLGVEGLA